MHSPIKIGVVFGLWHCEQRGQTNKQEQEHQHPIEFSSFIEDEENRMDAYAAGSIQNDTFVRAHFSAIMKLRTMFVKSNRIDLV